MSFSMGHDVSFPSDGDIQKYEQILTHSRPFDDTFMEDE